ncbi:MAG: isochorismatase family protein [Desulfobacterales bacterium]|jgi:nicotinamidase-related amidase|nr:isochorismatase family protein [Desulfobacterales bacterium]
MMIPKVANDYITDLTKYRFDRVEDVAIPTITRLLSFFRKHQLSVIYLTMGSRSKGLEYLLFTGVSTNMCVETTARDAADKGFRCVLIEDGCGASAQSYHDAAMTTFQRLFGKVNTSVEVIAELKSKIEP